MTLEFHLFSEINRGTPLHLGALNLLERAFKKRDEGNDFSRQLASLPQSVSFEDVVKHLRQNGHDALICSKAGSPVGLAAFQNHPDRNLNAAYLFYVLPNQRGADVASQIARELILRSRKSGIKLQLGGGGNRKILAANRRLNRILGNEIGFWIDETGHVGPK